MFASSKIRSKAHYQKWERKHLRLRSMRDSKHQAHKIERQLRAQHIDEQVQDMLVELQDLGVEAFFADLDGRHRERQALEAEMSRIDHLLADEQWEDCEQAAGPEPRDPLAGYSQEQREILLSFTVDGKYLFED